MNIQEEFFYEHAGYCCALDETEEDGRTRSARALAYAESEAARKGWIVSWSYDEEPCTGCECGSSECPCFTGEEHETYNAVLTDGEGHVLDSLYSICMPSKEYRRVVNAELALEALP